MLITGLVLTAVVGLPGLLLIIMGAVAMWIGYLERDTPKRQAGEYPRDLVEPEEYATNQTEPSEVVSQPRIVHEKEVIREVIKLRCRHCGHAFEERLDRCPHCGAPA
jgi:rubrerythrin